MKFWYEIQKGRFDFYQLLSMDICNALPLINLLIFFFGGGPGQGGALRVEGFIKCLELPFNIDKFMKQRTPDLSGQST